MISCKPTILYKFHTPIATYFIHSLDFNPILLIHRMLGPHISSSCPFPKSSSSLSLTYIRLYSEIVCTSFNFSQRNWILYVSLSCLSVHLSFCMSLKTMELERQDDVLNFGKYRVNLLLMLLPRHDCRVWPAGCISSESSKAFQRRARGGAFSGVAQEREEG